MDNDIFTLRERERDAKLQVLNFGGKIQNYFNTYLQKPFLPFEIVKKLVLPTAEYYVSV